MRLVVLLISYTFLYTCSQCVILYQGATEFLDSWENMSASLATLFDRSPKYAWVMKQVSYY